MIINLWNVKFTSFISEVSLDDVQARTTNLSDTFEITLNKGETAITVGQQSIFS